MYANTITTKKFSNDTLPLIEPSVAVSGCGEKEHQFSEYDCVYEKIPDDTYCMSMAEIAEEFSGIATNAISYQRASPNEISYFKRFVPVAVFSKLEDGRKNSSSFLATSLVAVDVDQKGISGTSIVDIDSIMERLATLRLSAVIYTTFSYRPTEPCFRILIDLGKDCGWDDYRRSCIWIRANLLADLCASGLVDGVSWSPVQPMALPYGYRYQKPIVRLSRGEGLWDLCPDQLTQVVIPQVPKTSKAEKAKSSAKNLRGQANELFVAHVGYLHKKLRFAKSTGASLQFWRSRDDVNPGLYTKNDWTDIFDPSKNNRFSLQYSVNDFQEALDHKPVPRAERVKAIRDWVESDVRYALFNENCGTGKSEALIELSGDSPADQRYVYTFLTIDNRDAFARRAQNAIIVKSTSEIISEQVGEQRAPAIFEVITDYYSSRMALSHQIGDRRADTESRFVDRFLEREMREAKRLTSTSDALRRCVDQGLISKDEVDAVRREYEKNKRKLQTNKHLLMTTRKFEFLVEHAEESIFENDVIFTDEHQVGMLTNIDVTREFEIYGRHWQPKKYDEIDRRKLHSLKRCIVTSETVAEYELRHNRIEFTEISTVGKTPDFESLEVLWVSSTSNYKKKGDNAKSNRQLIKRAMTEAMAGDVILVGDGINAEYNLVSCKGSNALRNRDTIILLSLPAPEELAQVMACTGLGLWEATSLVMSDKANQSIGRNQGYRNKDEHGTPSAGDNHCLLVLPNKDLDINLHYVTPKVVNAGHWMASNNGLRTLEEKKKDFYFREVIDQIVLESQRSAKK